MSAPRAVAPNRRRARLVILGGALASVLSASSACGGAKSATPSALAPTTGPTDAGAAFSGDGGGGGATGLGMNPTSSGPSAPLPVVKTPPAITIVSSKRSEIVPRVGTAACVTRAAGASETPGREVDKLAKACATASKMKLLGPGTASSQSASKAPLEVPFEAQAGRCYRVTFAVASTVKGVSVLVRDGDGAVAAEEISNGPTGATPRDGAVCFNAKDRAVIVASVGDGDGAFALQVLEGDRL